MAAKSRLLRRLYGVRSPSTLGEELELIGAQIAHLSERTVGEGQEKLNEEVNKLRETFEDLIDRAHDGAANSLDAVTSKVQERPMESMLGAFAAGAILAALLTRR